MKAENMTDVREWLLYHRWLGVDHIYLAENVVEPVATTTEQLRDLVAEGLVTYSNERVAQAQMKVYYDCLAKHAHKHDWMAFFDMDEYVVLVDRPDQKLPDFLRAYRAYPGLAVHWVLVGPSGRDARPAAGGVLRHYAQCGGRGDQGIKMIVNTAFVANICPHPHNFEFRDGMPPVDENFEPIAFNPHLNALSVCSPIPPARSAPGTAAAALTAALPFERLEYWTNADGRYCYAWPYPSKASASVGKIALFHYVTKSLADFSAKMARGPGIGKSKTWEFLLNTTRETTQWGGLCAKATRLAEACCPEDQLIAPAYGDHANVSQGTGNGW
eukprot:jgi/Ulvmu1/8696/UM047_0036.1